ncbi:hypothetical protein LY90DRAFT_670011 [Neocallimastix californiae]|uniref:Uncharacterized protein n=1 Tax=Neocallimastix californiae TaxID=1754190 RepID=A0A1Y2D5N6_9FUNG|nr:hypothetical protein LY90DRAFT_670011 [Neocallimastix californiae]|eukprot:ORY54406.1 hypothetical protein LY90DRAFT_670011 [Neocallimastix californiae]
MKLDSYINKIKITSKSNKNDENSFSNNKTTLNIPNRQNQNRKNSINSFFSVKSTNFLNRHKNILNNHLRDTKSDNNINLYYPDNDDINIKNTSRAKNNNKIENSLSSSKKKYPAKESLKNEKKKYSNHVSVPKFHLKNHCRSTSSSTFIDSPEISKISSPLKPSININNERSYEELNYHSSKTVSLSNLPITTPIMVSTPLSLPALVHTKSTSTIEPPIMTSSNHLMNAETPVNNSSKSRCTCSTSSLNYSTPIKTSSYVPSNSSGSTPSTNDEVIQTTKLPHQSSTTSIHQQIFATKITASPLNLSEFEYESQKKGDRTSNINNQSITSNRNGSNFSNVQDSKSYTVNICPKNKNQSQEKESSLYTLNNKKDILSNKNQGVKNIIKFDSCSTGCTNSNCTTFCNNSSYDKDSELKEDSSIIDDQEEIIKSSSSTTTISKDNNNTTYSLFMPKTVIGDGSLQNSFQSEINRIIERFDKSSLNEFSSIDPDKEDIPAIGNKLLLAYLNKDLIDNDSIKENENNQKEMKDGTISEINHDDNPNRIENHENSIMEPDSSILEEQKIYIGDLNIAFLDINRIKADISQSINDDKIKTNDSINVAPIIVSSFIPDTINNLNTTKLSKDEKDITSKPSKISPNLVDSLSNSNNEEGHLITTSTVTNINTNINYDINNKINNKKNSNFNDSSLNEKINQLTLNKLLHQDIPINVFDNTKTESNTCTLENNPKDKNSSNIIDNNNSKVNNMNKINKPHLKVRKFSLNHIDDIIMEKKIDNEKKLKNNTLKKNNKNESIIQTKNENKNENEIKQTTSLLNSTQLILPNYPNKPIIYHYKHQHRSTPQQVSLSYFRHYHHFSEGSNNLLTSREKNIKGNTNDELFKEEINQIESLNSLKTALLFLSKNEDKSIKSETPKKLFDSGSSFFSRKKSTDVINSSVFVSNSYNRKYLSLPKFFSSNNNNNNNVNFNINNIKSPLTANEKEEIMYSVDRLDSNRKLRAYYGIECPLFLGDGSKSKIANYYGAQIFKKPIDKESNESLNKKKNPKFVKRLTSLLHLSNNNYNNNNSITTNININTKNSEEISKKDKCTVENDSTQKDTNKNDDILSLYNHQGEIIQSESMMNIIQSTNNKIIVPVKNERTTKENYCDEVKNVSDLIKLYEKDSEIYSTTKEFSFKNSYSNTISYMPNQHLNKNISEYTKDESKTTFNMIPSPSHLKNVMTSSLYQKSFCNTEPYLSSFSFKYNNISEYSSSESSFSISDHQINLKQVIAKTSTTTNTQEKVNNPTILDKKTSNSQHSLELDNSYVIQKNPDIEEQKINEDNIKYNINGSENNSFNEICRHSTSKIINNNMDSLFLYQTNVNELSNVSNDSLSKSEIHCRKSRENKNTLNESVNALLSDEEIKSTLFKDLYDKSIIKDSIMSITTSSYSYDSYNQSDNLMEGCYSFILDEIYNGTNISNSTKHYDDNNSDSEDSNGNDEDYNFYDPPNGMNYSDNYLESHKKKFNLKWPTRIRNSDFNFNSKNNAKSNLNITKKFSEKENSNKPVQLSYVETEDNARIYISSSLNDNLLKDQSSTLVPDTKNIKTATTTTITTTSIFKHQNNQSMANKESCIKNIETKTTTIEKEKEDENDGYTSSFSVESTSINTELMISVTGQPKLDIGNVDKLNNKNRKSSLSIQYQPIELLKKFNNKTTILTDPSTKEIIKNKNSSPIIKDQKSYNEYPSISSYDNDGDNDDKNNEESLDIESDIDLVMKGDKSDYYELNFEKEEEDDDDDDDEIQNISYIKNHTKNSNTIHQRLVIEKKYKKSQRNEGNDENFSYSLSSCSQNDYYEEKADTEFSFVSNNVKQYHHQKAKHHLKNNNNNNNNNTLYQKDDEIESINYLTEENNKEYSTTEILKYGDYSNEPQYNGETFDVDKIENAEHYHSLLTKFLLELLRNKCSEYFFLFHDMIQFQYKMFQSYDQFDREGQEIFNTYLNHASTLKVNVDVKLVHKIAYGIKYYDRCCFIPLINMVLKVLESKYLKYIVHQSNSLVEDTDYKNEIMQEYCKVLDEFYSSKINSSKILVGKESPNQIYKNMLIRKKVYDFCILIFGKNYFTNCNDISSYIY